MRFFYFFLISALFTYSCRNVKNGGLMEVVIDVGLDFGLQLSEITEEITAIELELTDESMINPDHTHKVHIFDNLIFISELNELLMFDRKGKFIRSIGSRGQGPGEYTNVNHFTIDEKNMIIYIISNRKIIGYDLNGNFLKEFTIGDLNSGQITDINYFNNELFILAELIRHKQHKDNEKLNTYISVIYKLNNEMQFIDSCFYREVYYEGIFLRGNHYNYLTYNNSVAYLYNPEGISFLINFTPSLNQMFGTIDRVLSDTLYRFENNRLIPEMRLVFKRNGSFYNGDKNIQLWQIYRSSRYVFVEYETGTQDSHFLFCHDMEQGLSYNTIYKHKEVYIRTEFKKRIRPISNNTELFYYLQTDTEPDDLEEPNPTLYIGKLKQLTDK